MVFRALRAAGQSLASFGSSKPAQGLKLSTLVQAPRLLRGASLDVSSQPSAQRSPSLGFSPLSRLGATPGGTRPYVTQAGASVLNKVPVIQAAIKVATIQEHAECGANSGMMQVALADALTQTGMLEKDTSGDGKSRKHLECPITTRDLVQLNNLRGPLRLTVKNSLQPDQGRDQYAMHHCMLLAATFEDRNGRAIGVCIDGNDLTDNEATDALRLKANERGEWYPDGRLVADSKEMDEHRDTTGDDPRRGLVRLIALDQLQQANEGDYDIEPSRADALGVRVKGTLMTAGHQKLLQDGIEDGSLRVEEFAHVTRSRT